MVSTFKFSSGSRRRKEFQSHTFFFFLSSYENGPHHLAYVSEPIPRRQLLGCIRTCSDDRGGPFQLLLLVIHSPSFDLRVGFEDGLGSVYQVFKPNWDL
ncbi:hypothetical protein ACOSQ2_021945 [Xanthoceras sorbifolium]